MVVPFKRFRLGLIILGVIFLVAVTGYCLAGWNPVDAVYMTVITLSTVGFKEVQPLTPAMKLFTTVIVVFGVSVAVYIGGGFVQMMAEGEIAKALGIRRTSRQIEKLTGHVVICGFGRMGEILAGEMRRHKKPFVVIDKDPERISEATQMNYLAINDDATEEEALVRAHVQTAHTVVTTLPSDADNVFITLTSRNLNPKAHIIARGEFPSTEKKLIQAGADRVVLPAAAGALRMAALVTRPSMIELIEVVAGRHISEVEIDEVEIPADNPLVGTTVRDSATRSRHGLLIVGLRRADGPLAFNPGADTVFQAGDALIVMGRPDDIQRFRESYRI